jgi:hypothetical protein
LTDKPVDPRAGAGAVIEGNEVLADPYEFVTVTYQSLIGRQSDPEAIRA